MENVELFGVLFCSVYYFTPEAQELMEEVYTNHRKVVMGETDDTDDSESK